MAHYPGAGVGGECIPVDTWYLIKQAEKIGFVNKVYDDEVFLTEVHKYAEVLAKAW